MKIQELTNLNKTVKGYKNFAIVTVAASFLVVLIVWLSSSQAQSKLYAKYLDTVGNERWVLAEDGAVLKMSRKRYDHDTKKLEAKNHIAMILSAFYEFDPYVNFNSKLDKGLYLVNQNIGEKIVRFHEETDLRNKIQIEGMHLYIAVDSIIMEFNKNKLEGIAYAKQTIKKPKGVGVRHLDIDFEIEVLNQRTEKNPHGMVANRWNVINNSPLKIRNTSK